MFTCFLSLLSWLNLFLSFWYVTCFAFNFVSLLLVIYPMVSTEIFVSRGCMHLEELHGGNTVKEKTEVLLLGMDDVVLTTVSWAVMVAQGTLGVGLMRFTVCQVHYYLIQAS